MSPKYKYLFFDLDHTLWDFEANSRQTLEELYGDMALSDRGVHDFGLFHQNYLIHNEKLWDRYRNGFIKVDEIAYDDGGAGDKTMVGVEIHSGKNRIVRRLFEHFEYNVVKLDRVIFAGLTKKDLARGRWRFLTEDEINMLKVITGAGKRKV